MGEILPRARKMAASLAPGTPPSERVGWFLRCSSISLRFSTEKGINKSNIISCFNFQDI